MVRMLYKMTLHLFNIGLICRWADSLTELLTD